MLLLSSRLSLIVEGGSVHFASWRWSFYAFGCFVWLSGAVTDPEQLSLTEQLFDAALDKLSVVAGGQPCMMVGDFNVEPTKIPCLAKGISAGLWLILKVLGFGYW